MKKVLIITYYWPPSGGPGVQRWLKFAKYLPEFDIYPIILTVDSEKASYQLIDKTLLKEIPDDLEVYKTDTSEPFNAYKKITRKNEIPVSGFVNESQPSLLQKVFRFIRGNFFIPDPRKGWNKYAYAKAKELIIRYKIDTVITTSPPHSTQLIGLRLKRKFNISWIADLRDPWTDIYFYKELYQTKIAKHIEKKLEKRVLEAADKVIVVSDDIKRIFSNKLHKINAEKIKVIPNGYDETDFKKSVITEKGFVITYTGTITDKYDISSFVAAFENITLPKGFKIRIVGRVAKQIKLLFQTSVIANRIEYIDYQPHEKSIEYLKKSTMLLLVIPKINNNKGILTGKLFEYLAAQKPILNIGPVNGDAAAIIGECDAGRTFDYDEINGIRKYLVNLFKFFEQNTNDELLNRKCEKFSRRKLTEELSRIMIS